MKNKTGILYVCPTPIGNLEDITLRCLRVLKEVGFIAAEDTRVTQKLLNHFDIKTPLISYHKYSEKQKTPLIIEKLLQNTNIALVTDSGTPVISDPGNEVIAEAIKNSIKVVPLPGPSAITCALSASGIISEGFIFYGFLPKSAAKKEEILTGLAANQLPIVIFESPKRVLSTLESIYNSLGDVNVVLTRELSKIYEEITVNTVSEHISYLKTIEPRGEHTIIIDKIPINTNSISKEDIEILIKDKLKLNQSISSIAKELSEDLNCNKNYIYKLTLELAKEAEQVDNAL